MESLRLERVLTSTMVGLVLAVVGGAVSSPAFHNNGAIEMVAPVPGLANPARREPLAFGAGAPFSTPEDISPRSTESNAHPTLANLGAAADIPIAEKLGDLIGNRKTDRIFDRKREREAVEAFYSARSFVPLWIENGARNERAMAAISHLKAADADGLDPADYTTPELNADAEPSVLAEAELRLTAAVLTYARHAQSGRVHFSRISSEISYELKIPEPRDILDAMANAENVSEALAGYNPPHDGYKALKAKLAEMRRQTHDAGPLRIPGGPLLKIGMRDDRVPLLRRRLGISGGADSRAFDSVLAEAVKKFQRERKLPPNGNLDSATLDALNGQQGKRALDIIIANMERWRWMPRDLGETYSMLNVPDFSLTVVRDGAPVWKTKVVVGKVSTPTPIFSDTMKFITVNPTWTVPPSLMKNEYLPALQNNPAMLDRMGIRVARNKDGTLRMYQPPGERNALGRFRFNFPNKFIVYQHDTPDKYLFDKAVRAYSNGCMRVQDPLRYAEILLSIAAPQETHTQERLRKMYGGSERNINLPTHIPVHLTYQTAFVDNSGQLIIRNDVYGYDGRIQAALNGNNRRIADIAVPAVHHGDGGITRRRESIHRHDPRQAEGDPLFLRRLFQ